MESHSKVTLLMLLLCLAFSVNGARVLIAPETSPTPEASPSPRPASQTGGPAGSRRPFSSEDFSFDRVKQMASDSPKGSVAMKDLEAKLNGKSAKDAVNEAVKYVSELDASSPTESITNEMAPAASMVRNGLGPAASAFKNGAYAVKNGAYAVKDELAPTASAAMDKAAATMHKASDAMAPAASAAMNKAAAWAAELKGPSPN